MRRSRLAAAVTVAALASGCITSLGVIKHQDHVSVANIVEAGAADLALMAFFMFAAEDLSPLGAIASSIAFTGVDLGVACVLGTCKGLRP